MGHGHVGPRQKYPLKVKGGILQVCLNLNQSEVGFHRVNLLKYEFSLSTLQSRKNILRVCVIISCETIILEHYKPVEPVEHFFIKKKTYFYEKKKKKKKKS